MARRPRIAGHRGADPVTVPRIWPRAVIFDLDGTLVDSAPDIALALNDALGSAGHKPLALELAVSFVGGGARHLIERALAACGEPANAARIDRVYTDFLRSYARHPARSSKVYPGAIGVLEQLSAQRVQLGVCTNKPAALTTAVLDQLGLASYFQVAVAADGTLPLKPAPDMLRKAISELDARPDSALMMGDSAADAGAARAAGVRCVLLSHGYCHEPIDGLQADAVVDGFDAIVACLDQLAYAR